MSTPLGVTFYKLAFCLKTHSTQIKTLLKKQTQLKKI